MKNISFRTQIALSILAIFLCSLGAQNAHATASGSTTGTGNNVRATSPTITSPTLVTPVLGAATGTSLAVTSTIKTGGYIVSTLPSGTVGMRAYVTDQTTACPLVGGALTGTGLITCPVFYNGSVWVGD